MNKKELIAQVALRTGISQARAAEVVDIVFAQMQEGLRGGMELRLSGFGAFKLNKRAARIARHPHTGETVSIAAGKAVRFKPASRLREELTGGATTRSLGLPGNPVTPAPGLPGRPTTPPPGLSGEPTTKAPGTGAPGTGTPGKGTPGKGGARGRRRR